MRDHSLEESISWFEDDPSRINALAAHGTCDAHHGAVLVRWAIVRIGADRIERARAARVDGQPPADGLVTAARSVVDLVDRTVDMPGVVRDVVDNLRDALSAAPADDTAAPDPVARIRAELVHQRDHVQTGSHLHRAMLWAVAMVDGITGGQHEAGQPVRGSQPEAT